jgi:hypothetical protein
MNSLELDICFSLRMFVKSEEIKIVYDPWKYAHGHDDYNFVMHAKKVRPKRFKFTNLKFFVYSVTKNRFGPELDNISYQLAMMILQRKRELSQGEMREKMANYSNPFFYRDRT